MQTYAEVNGIITSTTPQPQPTDESTATPRNIPLHCQFNVTQPLQQQLTTTFDLHYDLPNIAFHPFTQQALRLTQGATSSPIATHVYTDASVCHTTNKAGWAMTVIDEDHDTFYYKGYQGGTIQDSVAMPTDDLTSTQAELVAILWAAIYHHQHNDGQQLHIHTDSLSSIQMLNNMANTTDPLANTIIALYWQLATTTSITLHHTKAHVGMPWNECADVMAKWFSF